MVHARQAQPAATRQRSLDQLAREQRIPSGRPDYIALFSKVWRTPDEVAAFQLQLRGIRPKASSSAKRDLEHPTSNIQPRSILHCPSSILPT